MLSVEERLKRFPPCVCRLLARTGGSNNTIRLLEDEEVAKKSGLHISEVRSIMWRVSWNKVAVEDVFSFSTACGVKFSDRKNLTKHYKYTQLKRPFAYLQKHPDYDTIWAPMFRMYSEYLTSKL